MEVADESLSGSTDAGSIAQQTAPYRRGLAQGLDIGFSLDCLGLRGGLFSGYRILVRGIRYSYLFASARKTMAHVLSTYPGLREILEANVAGLLGDDDGPTMRDRLAKNIIDLIFGG